MSDEISLFMTMKNKSKIRKSLYIKILSGIVFIIGILLIAVETKNLSVTLEEKSWNTTEGKIIKSQIIGNRAIKPMVIYEYYIEEVRYTDTSNLKVPMFGGKRKKYDVAFELISQYPKGGKVTVFYDPKEARRSTLKPGASWAVYSKLSLGLILFVVGLSSFIIILRRQ